MTEVDFVPYKKELHQDQMTQMFYEYGKWHDKHVYDRYNVHYFPDGNVESGIDRYIQRFNGLTPPVDILLLLLVGSKPLGMGWISRQEADLCEVDCLFIYPEYRGLGYGKETLRRLEDKAREFGYTRARLEFNLFNEVAAHIFRKAGYKETSPYYDITQIENENMRKYFKDKTYMEKILLKESQVLSKQ